MGQMVKPKRWLTPDYLSEYEKLFLLGLWHHISMDIAEGDFRRYQSLAEMGLIGLKEYNSWNRHVYLTRFGKMVAKQIGREYDYSWWEATKVYHAEFHAMVNSKFEPTFLEQWGKVEQEVSELWNDTVVAALTSLIAWLNIHLQRFAIWYNEVTS